MEDSTTIRIRELHEFSSQMLEAIQTLAQQIGKNYKQLTAEDFQDMLSSPNTTILIAESIEGQLIGMVTLVIYRIPYVRKAYLEDLVVDEASRGQGIGKMLIQHVMELAQKKGAAYLDFTSRPRREEENKFYEKLGFQKRETNVYRHIFDYGEV